MSWEVSRRARDWSRSSGVSLPREMRFIETLGDPFFGGVEGLGGDVFQDGAVAALAATAAMPRPMVPAPMTVMVWTWMDLGWVSM